MFLRRRKARYRDVERELLSHLDLEANEQRDTGMSQEQARSAARRVFGNVTLIAEEIREMGAWGPMEYLLQDLRYGMRTLRKSPGFTLAAVLTLALGIGANSAMFSIVNGLLLKPLALDGTGRLIEVFSRDPQGQRVWVSQADLDDWRAAAHSFSSLASWVPQSVNLTGREQPERILGTFVSSNFFSTLGASPAMGRAFAPGEDRSGGARVAVISNGLWRSRFGSTGSIVGTSAEFNGESYTIVGVLPPSFVFPFFDADVYLPAFAYPNYSLDRARTNCAVIGRLRDGVSIGAARAEMNTVASHLAASYPATNKGRGTEIVSLKEDLIADLRPSVIALAGAVALVLLIGCANVASLLIARMVARDRERAVRIALGAGRVRLMSHLLTEALLLAACGGGLGSLLTFWSVPAIAALIAVYLPYGIAIAVDRSVLGFTLGVSIGAALLVAAIPAFQAWNPMPLRAGRGAAAARHGARSLLVAVEIALALVLSIGAGLMIRSFSELGRTAPGFDTQNLLTLAYRVPRNKYPTGAQQVQFHREVVERIQAIPGILSASSVRAVPLGGNGNTGDFMLTDRPEPPPAERPQALLNFADPDFFSTMRIPLLQGRAFTGHDDPAAPYVIIINQTLARRYFDGRNPIGQHLRIPSLQQTAQIVGVVADVKQFTLRDPATPQIYGSLAQNPFVFTSLAVRTKGDPTKVVNEIRAAIWGVDKDQPVWSVHTFNEILRSQSRLRGLMTTMLGAYAAFALLLASIGVFGVVSYTVSQRVPEIGVRMALGARRADVVLLILRQGMFMAAIGIGAGLPAALWLSRYVRTLLYAVTPNDPLVYMSAIGVLAAVSAAACLLPARRAANTDPMASLRCE